MRLLWALSSPYSCIYILFGYIAPSAPKDVSGDFVTNIILIISTVISWQVCGIWSLLCFLFCSCHYLGPVLFQQLSRGQGGAESLASCTWHTRLRGSLMQSAAKGLWPWFRKIFQLVYHLKHWFQWNSSMCLVTVLNKFVFLNWDFQVKLTGDIT